VITPTETAAASVPAASLKAASLPGSLSNPAFAKKIDPQIKPERDAGKCGTGGIELFVLSLLKVKPLEEKFADENSAP
jgi:hypothetical protein